MIIQLLVWLSHLKGLIIKFIMSPPTTVLSPNYRVTHDVGHLGWNLKCYGLIVVSHPIKSLGLLLLNFSSIYK